MATTISSANAANAAAEAKHPVDIMADLYHDALIQTGKALQAASKDGRGNVTQAGAVVQTRIPALFEKFHANLNDIESMILDAKATLERDLKLIKARQRPPPTTAAAPATMSEPMAVAPPAPMVIDLESPQQGTTSLPTSSALVSRPAGESRPVAPFPNMDFDFVASPEVPPAKVPTPVMKTKDAKKNSPRPSALQVAAMVGRPSSAPARKETKAPPPQAQAPRSAASTPQPPPISVPVARQTAKPPVPIAATAAATGAGNLFTSMAFSVELPTTEAANPLPTAAQNTGQLANELATKGSLRIDLTDLRGPGDISGLSLKGVDGLSNMDQEIPGENGREGGHDVANIDSRIDGLFGLGSTDLGGMNIDFDLGGDDGGGKTQFDDFFLADSKDHGGGGGFEF